MNGIQPLKPFQKPQIQNHPYLFLKESKVCVDCFYETIGKEQFLSCELKYFDAGALENTTITRTKDRKYIHVEENMINYVKLCVARYHQDKCRLSWKIMRDDIINGQDIWTIVIVIF